MEKCANSEDKFSKRPLKKELSFDEKVTEIRLGVREGKVEDGGILLNNGGIRWWNPPENHLFANFCKSTSIHGLQYLGHDGVHFGERILWAVLFVLSAATSLWLIYSVIMKYLTSPVVITFNASETFVGEVPFPAVTICNMNRVLKSKANEYMKIANSSDDYNPKVQAARRNIHFLDHVCSVSNKPFSKLFNYSMKRGSVDPSLLAKPLLQSNDNGILDVQQFLQKAAQPCKDMIQLCMYEGKSFVCRKEFRPIETNFGMCCVFNKIPYSLINKFTSDSRDAEEQLKLWKVSEEEEEMNHFKTHSRYAQHISNNKLLGNKYPFYQHRAGKASGLMFLVDPALGEYFCTNSDSLGFRLSVHYYTDVPHVSDFGLAIRPSYEHFVSVKPDLVNADDDIRSYSLDKRNCYFGDEFPLKYYSVYSASNCLDECVANITYEECKCVRYYMPRDDSRTICRPEEFTCAEDVKLKMFKSGVKNMCQQCLPTCTEVRYSTSVTLAPLQKLDLWFDESKNRTAPWAKKNVSIIHVYFGEESTYPKVRSQLYGITDLISNTGGLLGLCMGFSIISLWEVIYYFTVRPWCRHKEDRFSKTQNQSTSDSTKNGYLDQNGKEHNHAEARRVNMKPGDDGKFHLQSKRSSPPPLYKNCCNHDCNNQQVDNSLPKLQEDDNSQL